MTIGFKESNLSTSVSRYRNSISFKLQMYGSRLIGYNFQFRHQNGLEFCFCFSQHFSIFFFNIINTDSIKTDLNLVFVFINIFSLYFLKISYLKINPPNKENYNSYTYTTPTCNNSKRAKLIWFAIASYLWRWK